MQFVVTQVPAYEVLSHPRYPLPMTIYTNTLKGEKTLLSIYTKTLLTISTKTRGEDKGDQRQLSNDSSPARANGPENRHMSDGDGVCVGDGIFLRLSFSFNSNKLAPLKRRPRQVHFAPEKFGPKIM